MIKNFYVPLYLLTIEHHIDKNKFYLMAKKITKNYISDIPQYDLGGWMKEHAGAIGSGLGVGLGALGSVLLPGVGTIAGASLGASIGSALGGSVGGIVQSDYQANQNTAEQKRLQTEQMKAMQPIMANVSAKSMYGIYAKGGDIDGEVNPIINIEKGELAVQRPEPNSRVGKIVQEFTGKNPLTGSEYKPHAKRKSSEPVSNYVPTEMVKDELKADYIISKKYAKQYKDAAKRKDKFTINSILRNIDAESEMGKDTRNIQMRKGGAIPSYGQGGLFNNLNPNQYAGLLPNSPLTGNKFNLMSDIAPVIPSVQNTVIPELPTSTGLGEQDNTLRNQYLLASIPGAINMARGMFEKTAKQEMVNPVFNPYESQALGKLSGRVSSKPALDELNNQRNSVIGAMKQNTPTGSVLRSNLQGLFGNTGKAAGNIINQTRQANLGLDAQQSQGMMNAGAQRVNAIDQARGTNLQLNQMNLQSQAAKDNMLYAGISDIPKQRLQLMQNQDAQDMEAFKMMMLMDTFGTSKDLYNQPKYAKFRKRLGL